MKKFTRILVCLMLFVFAFSFVACGGKNKDKFVYPTAGMATQGNGGMSVQKGNYLYFVNGFKSISSSDINKKTNYTIGSLMVTKLDENGNPVLDDGGLQDDYYRTMTNKLVGYEVADLHVFGDYLYFASPCLENEYNKAEDKEVWARNKVIFYRVKLNNSGKMEKLYQSKVDYSKMNYTYYVADGKVFILIHEVENNKIVRIDANSSDVSQITQVSSVYFTENNEDISNIFYINNNKLYRYNVATNVSNEYCGVDSSAKIKFVGGGYVYITKSHGNGSSNTDLYISKISDKSEFKVILAESSYDDVRISLDGRMIVCLDDTMVEYYIPSIVDAVPYVLIEEESTINIIGFNESDMFYYVTSEDNIIIKSVSVNNVLAGSESEVIEIATLSDVDKTYFDIEEDYIYFYKTAGNADNLYLHRVRVNNPDSTQSAQMVGVYIDSDITK